MKNNTYLDLFRRSRAGRPAGAGRRRSARPLVERLEDRQLLAVSALSAVQQYGVPSVFAIDNTGNVSYNFLTVSNGTVVWNGWTPIIGGIGASAISTGTVLPSPLVSAILRPNIFLLNTANNIYYNSEDSRGNWNEWSPVGVNVGATAIATGLIPLANAPYVFMVNGADNVYYSYQASGGSWAAWSPVGVGVGATAISTGVIQVSTSPAIWEPYVVMVNGANDVYYQARSTNGTWGGWSPVGVGVGAVSISAVTFNNKPYVTMLNGAGSTYVNFGLSNGGWAGWSPVGIGAGIVGATPATAMAAIASDHNIYDLAVNEQGQVNSTYGSYGNWSMWLPLGSLAAGVSATSISATSSSTAAPFAFAIGTDGNVYWIDQTKWATWSVWASLGTPS